MLRHREVIGASGPLGEHAHLVDEVGDELAPPDLKYLDGLSRGLQGGMLPHLVACRTITVNQDPPSLPTYNDERVLQRGLHTILAQLKGR